MRLTNKLNLPQPLVDAVKNDGYSKGDADISVTELLSPPRIVALSRKHLDEIVEDCADRVWSLLGQLMHSLLERANTTGVAERRLSIVVEGWKVSGGMDAYYEHGLLQDYKLTTCYKFKGGTVPTEFVQQLNCYAEILRQNGHKVTKLEVVGIIRDWSKLEAARDADYPQTQVVVREVPLWPAEVAQKFMRERVILHKQARVTLPECSAEERWAKPDVFAVMRKGAKRAVKLHDNAEAARMHALIDPALYIEYRPGSNTRCDHYCRVSKFCGISKLGLVREKEAQKQAISA